MSIKERARIFCAHKGIKVADFERASNLSNGYLNNVRKSPSLEKVEGIRVAYPDLNVHWLITGQGEMLKTQSMNTVVTGDVSGNGNQIVAGNNNHIATPHPKPEDLEVIDAEEVEIKETIILGADVINKVGVDLRKELKKSPEDMVLDVEVKPTQDVLPPHEVKIYTENDEMASDIEPNDPVFAHLIPSPKLFKPRHMYLVNLEYGSVVRWVVPEGEDHIRLVSRKGSDVVPISSVKAMFEVVAITKRPKTLPIDLTTESQRMERKESQLNTMLEQQGRLIGIIEGQIKHE